MGLVPALAASVALVPAPATASVGLVPAPAPASTTIAAIPPTPAVVPSPAPSVTTPVINAAASTDIAKVETEQVTLRPSADGRGYLCPVCTSMGTSSCDKKFCRRCCLKRIGGPCWWHGGFAKPVSAPPVIKSKPQSEVAEHAKKLQAAEKEEDDDEDSADADGRWRCSVCEQHFGSCKNMRIHRTQAHATKVNPVAVAVVDPNQKVNALMHISPSRPMPHMRDAPSAVPSAATMAAVVVAPSTATMAAVADRASSAAAPSASAVASLVASPAVADGGSSATSSSAATTAEPDDEFLGPDGWWHCPLCPKYYGYRKDLRGHRGKVHGIYTEELYYECPECDYTPTKNRWTLIEHIAKVHPDVRPCVERVCPDQKAAEKLKQTRPFRYKGQPRPKPGLSASAAASTSASVAASPSASVTPLVIAPSAAKKETESNNSMHNKRKWESSDNARAPPAGSAAAASQSLIDLEFEATLVCTESYLRILSHVFFNRPNRSMWMKRTTR